MSRLLLLRHGQSVWNAEHRWQGLADVALSPTGEQQAAIAGGRLAAVGFAAVVASPLERSRRTAEIVAEAVGLSVSDLVDELRERDVGEWQGLTSEEIEQRWPGLIDQWRHGHLERLPGGEGDITGRVIPAVERLARAAATADGPFLAVTHGGVISAVERHLQVEPCRARNVCGRWVAWREDRLVADEAVVLADDDRAAPTTAL